MLHDRNARLVTAIDRLDGDRPFHVRLCDTAVEVVDVTDAALILMSDREVGTVVAASGPGVTRIEDLQFALGEGPCLEAYHAGTPILEGDLRGVGAARWPMFTAAALAVGAEAVFGVPLVVGAIRCGVLYLCRGRPGALTDEQLADAIALAAIGTTTVLDLHSAAAVAVLGATVDGVWHHRAVVHQATGMVSVQLGASLAEALARIRATAFASDRSIYDVAVDVVAGRERFQQ